MPAVETSGEQNVDQNSLQEALMVRAVARAGGITPSFADEALAAPRAFSLYDDDSYTLPYDDILGLPAEPPLEEDVIFSALGEQLASPWDMLDKKERLALYPVALGTLAGRASISMATGCWSVVGEWRNHKGYAFTWKPREYGYHTNGVAGDFNGVQIHRMAFNMKRRITGLPDLSRYQHLDHICRWPGCCNIDHLEIVTRDRNNELRDRAKELEQALMVGQTIFGPCGFDWLEQYLMLADKEETNILVTTPDGPRRIIKMNDDPLVFRGQPEPDDLFEAVLPPAPNTEERRSRARILTQPEGLLDRDGYQGRKKKMRGLYRDWQKTGQF